MKFTNPYQLLILIIFIPFNFLFAQNIDNNLQGYFVAQSDESMYSFFEFDGNGKVNIVGAGSGDYFIKGDSLIVYPDKSIFKFKIKNNTLTGVSDWVENQVWIKKDTIVVNNRTNDAVSKNNAKLLNEYYALNGDKSPLEFLLDENSSKLHKEKLEILCEKGLSKACMDYFGLLIIDEDGLESLMNPNKKNGKPKLENPKIIALANKIIAQGEIEGHTILGSYYFMLNKVEKAKEQWEKGTEKGSLKSALLIMGTEE